MAWSSKLQSYVANSGRPEFRRPVLRVIEELNRLDNPEAVNTIQPLEVDGLLGIGINHQRKMWFLVAALWFIGLLVLFTWPVTSLRLRDPQSGEMQGWVVMVPVFSAFAVLGLLLYLKKPGPNVVVIAGPTSLYLVSRAGLRTTPKEVVIPWSSEQVVFELQTITQKMVTTHTIQMWRVRRDDGKKSSLLRTHVDPQGFSYWENFQAAVDQMHRTT